MSKLDPRRGLPSASSMYRVANCPGSVALVNALRREGKYYELPNPWASSGTRIHQYLALERDNLPEAVLALQTREELNTAQKCVELRETILNDWLRPTNGDEEQPLIEFVVERRLWYRIGIWPRFSGQPDLVTIDRTNQRGLIVNYKSGRLESEEARDNLQLRTEVALLHHVEPTLTEIDAVIDEPWVSWTAERVRYAGEALQTAENEILAICSRAEWESNNRIAGPWCVHCPARTRCREALDYVQALPNPEVMTNAIVELPRGDRGVVLWERLKLGKKLIKELEETYTQILETEPGALPGYVLPAEGRKRKVVTDPLKLKLALGVYFTGAEVDERAEFYLGKLEEALGIKLKITGKELEQKFYGLVKDAIGFVRDKPFVRPMTKKERDAASPAPAVTTQEALTL